MSPDQTSGEPGPDDRTGGRSDRVNRFAFKIGTPNGTGSASANSLLRTAIFRMGIPVSGKNLFPSNIQGLPTWYEIRVNASGHVARTPRFDLLVAMNPASYERDVAEVVPGGWVLHDSTWPFREDLRRDDVHFLGVPLSRMCVDEFEGARVRILMKNIGYVGALTALLDIDVEIVEGLLEETFARKKKLLDANFTALRLGRDYALEHFDCPLPIRLEAMDANADKILIDGNTAAALGCVYAGATVAAWYPITPSTSLVDAFTAFCEKHRKDPETGRNLYAIVQAEDELAAAGIVIGAGWSGARAFTSTSGAGISLMSEFIGLAYYAETPSVFFDIQRTGPSTGMPTRTQQGDILMVAYASHGDTKHVVLFPADPAECFDFAVRSFDLAERFQTPVFVVSDLDIGMNDWVVPRLDWDDGYRPDRGKVLSAEELEAGREFFRYLDVDGDGIPYRTLPGVHPAGAYFTRGSGHDRYGKYTEDSRPYMEVVDRLVRKVEGAAEHLPEPEVRTVEGARAGLVTVGSCRGAVLEAMEWLREKGVAMDYLRVRGFPFAPDVEAFLEAHEVNVVVEQNRDAQLRSLLALETGVEKERLLSVRYYGGQPLSAHHVLDGVASHWERLAATASDAGTAGEGEVPPPPKPLEELEPLAADPPPARRVGGAER
ncbi:MAG: 2-oxoacid:acceptor oxidoreductase subunit alpha [Gemmatimonadetes bacterium]|nr:2-oxoacid:acceptor oxidoreductase subunit alpha [Gemmatimonadota bacterium]NIR77822.1 2-oxoacid:acceptor oxidoreductase subunit alpha [Gemmatimonadota bacterium]NIT86361.1 2-oxoacid:acceptor oxidoreductase subunit alpha [Gemmatimonadota bacterium]NIU30195.1 2-oxoacid:acceptor oxidoreductase subunit alpha [Gemmatimonadota bacterium]NIU35112.1 2-oxoacid:acceptor oxidoreductase subunit alpha [Gemmatimonadota bacterium]